MRPLTRITAAVARAVAGRRQSRLGWLAGVRSCRGVPLSPDCAFSLVSAADCCSVNVSAGVWSDRSDGQRHHHHHHPASQDGASHRLLLLLQPARRSTDYRHHLIRAVDNIIRCRYSGRRYLQSGVSVASLYSFQLFVVCPQPLHQRIAGVRREQQSAAPGPSVAHLLRYPQHPVEHRRHRHGRDSLHVERLVGVDCAGGAGRLGTGRPLLVLVRRGCCTATGRCRKGLAAALATASRWTRLGLRSTP